MTKEEFMGFSSAAQHDMVLEALVRVTQNLGTMEKENDKPFVGTVKQRMNDVKLLTILAEAFGKNELVWDHKPRVTVDTGKYMPDAIEGIRGIRDDAAKIVGSQQRLGHFREPKISYGAMVAVNDKIERARRTSELYKESRDEDKSEENKES